MAMEDDKKKEPFVSQADRPEVRLRPDMPVAEMTLRELAAVLGLGTRKDFWDGKDFLKDDFDGGNKVKEFKETKEFKEGKEFKDKDKPEKREKPEIKEVKAEKAEVDGIIDPARPVINPDPRIEQILKAVAGLTERVDGLVDQMEALRKAQEG